MPTPKLSEAAVLRSLLYVSRSRLTSTQAASEVEELARLARLKNERLGITGALMFTQARFAQVIEGSVQSLDDLMSSILKDARHTDVRIIRAVDIEERRFGEWSMAYAGPSFYVNRHIKPLVFDKVNESDRKERANQLLALMHEFTRGNNLIRQST